MREMKDSGVEWIGEIPKDWDIIQVKKLLAARDGGSWGEEPQEDQFDRICYRVADFDFSRLAIVSDAELTVRNYTQPIIDKLSLERGDILVEKSGGGDKTPVGRAVLYDKDEPALFANIIERLRVSSETSPRYFFYVWIALYLTGFTNNYIKQTTGIQNLDIKSLVSSVFVPSFDLNLQHRIADYLDAKCAQIDRAIARQQEVIEKLKKYKLSVITEAVTKGLNPDVPMKDSRIEWIGEIPEHWVIRKIRWDFSVDLGKMLDAKQISGQYLGDYLRNTDVQWNSINFENLPQMDFQEAESERYQIKAGDLLVCEGGEIGRCAIVPDDFPAPMFYQKALHRVRIRRAENGDVGFLAYVMFCMSKNQYFFDSPEKSTIAHLPAESLNGLRIPSPRKEEQMDIVRFLNNACRKIDEVSKKKLQTIDKLTEYKKSLIYEVVTGKREV